MDGNAIRRQYASENAWISRHGSAEALDWLFTQEYSGPLGSREFASIKSPSVGDEAILQASQASEEMLRSDRFQSVAPKSPDDEDDDGYQSTGRRALFYDKNPISRYGKPNHGELPFWGPRNFRSAEDWQEWHRGFWYGDRFVGANRRRLKISAQYEFWRTPLRIVHEVLTDWQPLGPWGAKDGIVPRKESSGPVRFSTWPRSVLPFMRNVEKRKDSGRAKRAVYRMGWWSNRDIERARAALEPETERWPWISWLTIRWINFRKSEPGAPPQRRSARRAWFRNELRLSGGPAPEIEARRLRACGNELEALRVEGYTVQEIANRVGLSKRTTERRIEALELQER
jgi:hypothetical protein